MKREDLICVGYKRSQGTKLYRGETEVTQVKQLVDGEVYRIVVPAEE